MTKQELDSFVAENGTNNTKGVDDKWRGTTVEFCITQKVKQQSRLTSPRGRKTANTVNFYTKTKDLDGDDADCKKEKSFRLTASPMAESQNAR